MSRGTATFAFGPEGFTYDKPNRQFKGKNIIAFPNEYVVIDLETTGLSSYWDFVIEIGALKIKNGEITDQFQQLIYPGMEIDEFIEQFTGITNEMLIGQPYLDDILPKLDDFIGENIILGHNTNFDINFLYDNYIRCLGKPFSNNFIDNMRLSRKLYPELPHHRLIDIIEKLNIEASTFHRALIDCNYTYKCFELMKDEISARYGSLEAFQALFKYQYVDLTKLKAENKDFDETHPLYNKVCVFTGKLEKYTREQAAQMVVNLGGLCENNVTKKTNFLILGNNDYCSAIKDGKSNKQKKAEAYKLKGQDIEIIPESVFYDMFENS